MGKGSSGPSGPQTVEQTTTNIPDYARPYFENLLNRAQYESERTYSPYPGQRLADFNLYETDAMSGIADMAYRGDPVQLQQASELAAAVGYQDPNQAMQIANAYRPMAQFSGYRPGTIQTGYEAGDLDPSYQAGQFDVGYQPMQFEQFYDPRERQSRAQDLGTGFRASDFDAGYAAGDIAPEFTAGSLTDPEVLQQYMNPYQQLVTDIEKREAVEAAEKTKSDIGLQAAGAGGLGGYREAILLSEADKNLQQQLADIQAKGGAAAYDQALAAFEADRAARAQEETFRQQAFSIGEGAKQEAASLGLTAQQQEEASRQAQEEFLQSAFGISAEQRAQEESFDQAAFQFGEQARQQAAEMDLSVQQQQDAANQAMENFRQAAFQQNEAVRLAQAQEERAVFQAVEGARQEGARLGLAGQELQERINQAANAARMEARAANNAYLLNQANLAMEAVGQDRAARDQILSAAQQLGGLAGQDQRMDFERLRNLQAAGQNFRDLTQRSLDIGYEDFLRQQAFPQEQLGFFSNILQGIPVRPGTTTAQFGGSPTEFQQLLGAGISGVGLYNALT